MSVRPVSAVTARQSSRASPLEAANDHRSEADLKIQHIAALLLALALGRATAQGTPRSRLVVVGEVDTLLVGQDGYCGSMERVSSEDLQRIIVDASKATFVRYVRGGSATRRCTLDFSFTPQPGQAYIARYSADLGHCQVELFHVRPGQDPARERLNPENVRSCLGQ